jgi:hypothetical protein
MIVTTSILIEHAQREHADRLVESALDWGYEHGARVDGAEHQGEITWNADDVREGQTGIISYRARFDISDAPSRPYAEALVQNMLQAGYEDGMVVDGIESRASFSWTEPTAEEA